MQLFFLLFSSFHSVCAFTNTQAVCNRFDSHRFFELELQKKALFCGDWFLDVFVSKISFSVFYRYVFLFRCMFANYGRLLGFVIFWTAFGVFLVWFTSHGGNWWHFFKLFGCSITLNNFRGQLLLVVVWSALNEIYGWVFWLES